MSLLVVLSEVSDGSMYDPSDKSNKTIIDNRKRFLKEHSIKMQQTTRLDITYNEDDFCKYREVSSKDMGAGMSDVNVFSADALITRSTNHALFLPLADCVGTVIYDKRASILMLTHLGRQSVEQDGGRKSVEYLVTNYGSIAEDLLVWLAPAPGKEKYPLYAFDNRDFKEVVYEQLLSAGIQISNITDNQADTTKDPRYFSFSESLRGRTEKKGRHSILAMMS
jgi:copper oxidase (laccase) domain-containing protein